jgi:hypothetical protein
MELKVYELGLADKGHWAEGAMIVTATSHSEAVRRAAEKDRCLSKPEHWQVEKSYTLEEYTKKISTPGFAFGFSYVE